MSSSRVFIMLTLRKLKKKYFFNKCLKIMFHKMYMIIKIYQNNYTLLYGLNASIFIEIISYNTEIASKFDYVFFFQLHQ